MANKIKYHIFGKSVFSLISLVVIGIIVLFRGSKEKTDFLHIKSKIVYYDSSYQDLPGRNYGKYRYIALDGFPVVFEVFIGKDFGDFKPESERIDDLRIGDEIDIYYDESEYEKDKSINRLVQFIDKDNKPYFVKGRTDIYFGIFIFIIAVFIFIWLLYLKKKGSIS